MTSARTEVLARIRSANAHAGHPGRPEIPRDYHRSGPYPPGSAAVSGLLTDRLSDYQVSVVDGRTTGIAPAIVAATSGVDGAIVVPPDLPPGWCPEGVPDAGFRISELDRFGAVVTACAAACAETGTIALDAGPAQGRRALTLLPDVHVCVVRGEQVVETVPELLALLDPIRPITLVSGPSATSDIELERVAGVHGPRTLIVVLA